MVMRAKTDGRGKMRQSTLAQTQDIEFASVAVMRSVGGVEGKRTIILAMTEACWQ